MNELMKHLMQKLGLDPKKVTVVDLNSPEEKEPILDAFKKAMGEGPAKPKPQEQDLTTLDYNKAKQVLADLAFGENLAKIRLTMAETYDEMSDEEFAFRVNSILNDAACQCGDPRHLQSLHLLAFLHSIILKRVLEGPRPKKPGEK